MKPYIGQENSLGAKFSALKLILVLGLGLFLLIFPKIGEAYLFEDNFDSYELNQSIHLQGDWEVYTTYDRDYFTTSSITHTENISIVRIGDGAYCMKKEGEEVEDVGYFSFWIYPDDWATSTSYTSFSLDPYPVGCAGAGNLEIRLFAPTSTEELSVYGRGDGGLNFLGNIDKGEWSAVNFYWNKIQDVVKYRLKFENWSEFNLDEFGTVNAFLWMTPVDGLTGNIYLDTIKTTEAGVCGFGEDCIFCSTRATCENYGCYWIEMFFPIARVCVEASPLIETATGTHFDFDTYYATTSLFATPTAFISRLAQATSPILLILSSWLEGFSDIFDLAEAQQKGLQLGNAIPQARGYLGFFDSFFAGLPLSEILLVYLVILVGLIIFRIIRQIKKLIAV